ncbi:MAG: hypothetical protein KF817_07375 [Phycisphaeraceae bacterium]|nr:hypothetical protein [Phycisphaeraceae bacterium]
MSTSPDCALRLSTRVHRERGAFARADLLALTAAGCTLTAISLPILARGSEQAGVAVSLWNLQNHAAALAMYALDWNDRQPSWIAEDIAAYGTTPAAALPAWIAANGPHPNVVLGWGPSHGNPGSFGLWQYPITPGLYLQNLTLCQPIVFQGSHGVPYFGAFRVNQARPLHDYLDGRFYDPVYFAPNDTWTWNRAAPYMSLPYEFIEPPSLPGIGTVPVWSSYCLSPAAMLHPACLATGPDGYEVFQSPWSFADGFRAPTVGQARFPSLKTRLMEHQWNQGAPRGHRCNPAMQGPTPDPHLCEPYYFNHAYASEPATLFFDGSTRLLPTAEVVASDQQLLAQTGRGVWHRSTPFGTNGYFNDRAAESFDFVSHHVLTIDGILGRDTIGVKVLP